MGMTTVKEQIEVFQGLGFTEFTAEKAAEIENSWNEMPEEIRESLDMAATLLTEIGDGTYDYEEDTWEPSSREVFSFDVEVYNIEEMFTNVLSGIKAINRQEFEITQVFEESEEDEEGMSKKAVQFCYNGKPYKYETEIDGDWFDVEFLKFFNQVLEQEENPKRLLVTSDEGQELIVFYNTEEWAEEFERKTELRFGEEEL